MFPNRKCTPPKISPNPKSTLTKNLSSNRNHYKIRWLQKIFFAFCSRGCRINFPFLQPRLQNQSIIHQWLQNFKTAAESRTAAEKPPTQYSHFDDVSNKIGIPPYPFGNHISKSCKKQNKQSFASL